MSSDEIRKIRNNQLIEIYKLIELLPQILNDNPSLCSEFMIILLTIKNLILKLDLSLIR